MAPGGARMVMPGPGKRGRRAGRLGARAGPRRVRSRTPFTPVRLKARYKMLVKEHHPDAHGGDKAAEEKLKIINQAYATLKASYFN